MFWKKSVLKDEQIKFNAYSIYEGHHNVTYKGVKAIRCPFDYVIYQMIIFDIMPDLIIEIGTHTGGGTLYLADLLNIIGTGMVHTIDIHGNSDPSINLHPRIEKFTEGWEKYDINLVNEFEKVLVIEDASHTYENTLNAIKKFAPIVSKNSYLIVEDGIINELGMEQEYFGGPLKAIREFLQFEKNFIVDRRWCDMFGKNATFNVNGYLKKID